MWSLPGVSCTWSTTGETVVKRINELLRPGGFLVSATECMAEKKTPITSLLSFLMKIGIFPISGSVETLSYR